MENKEKIPILISIISILATSALGVVTYVTQTSLSQAQTSLSQAQTSLSQAIYDLQVASMRANMSILVNPQFDQNWTFVDNGVFLTVNGTLRNEGSRQALVLSMDLSATYHFSDGTPYVVSVRYSDLPEYCKMNSTTMPEKEEASFSISIFINSGTVAIIGGTYTSHAMQSLVIGNSRSDNFTVSVAYFDGISDLQSKHEFNAK